MSGSKHRRAIVLAVVGVLAIIAVPVAVWWSSAPSANERHVNALLEETYELAGFGDQPAPKLLGYDRDSFETGCVGVDDDRWVGRRTATRVDPEVDWRAGAEVLAGALEADGWDVVRWWWLDPATDRDERWVVATRGDDRVQMVVNTNSVDLVASSGPCNPTLEPVDPGGAFEAVGAYVS